MKKSSIFLLFLLFATALSAQKMSIKLSTKSNPVSIFNKINLTATITNNTSEPIRLFRNHLTTYGGVGHVWKVVLNGKEIKTFKGHAQDTNSGFRASNFVLVQPRASYRISGYALTLDEPGDYEVSFAFSQSPDKVNLKWGESSEAKSLAQAMTKMAVSETFKFNIPEPVIKPFVAKEATAADMSSKKQIKNFAQAKTDPSNAFNLLFSTRDEDVDYSADWKALGEMKNLRKLELQIGKKDVILPSTLGEIPLQQLKISSSGGKVVFPEGFLTQASLKVIEMSGVKFSEMPDFIRHHKDVNKIIMYGTGMNSIPDWVGDLTEITQLTLCDNEVTKIPASLNNLTKLYRVNFSSTKIERLENLFGNPEIREFKMSNCRINSIDPKIAAINKCYEIDLTNNQLTTIPAEIYLMEKINTLRLNKNKITSLPAGIENAKNLHYIYADDNQIKNLPKGISKSPTLKYLYIRRNPIQKDSELKALKKLIKNRKGKLNMD